MMKIKPEDHDAVSLWHIFYTGPFETASKVFWDGKGSRFYLNLDLYGY